LNDQELRVSFTYWEGAVKIEGTQSGYGYIELTGYNESIQGRL
jgi:predicted secreted hydrolase